MSDWSLAFSQEGEEGEGGYGFDQEDESALGGSETNLTDALLILLDCSKSMHTVNDTGESYFLSCIKLIAQMFKNKIITANKDVVGLCLFGTKSSKNTNNFPGVHVFVPLDEPAAQTIKTIESLREPAGFAKVGSIDDSEVDLQHALWSCSAMFTESDLKKAHKRIILLTANDQPYADAAARARAIQKGRDLRDNDIQLELIRIAIKGKTFDVHKFYKEICSIPDDEATSHFGTTSDTRFAELQEQIFRKQFKKRALGSVELQLGEGLNIGIKLYCMLREAAKEPARFLDAKTNDPLTCVTKWVCADTGEMLEEHQIKKYFPYGDQQVIFSSDEMKKIKDFGDPGLILMGFKPQSTLKSYHNIKNPYFIYPDEGNIVGSTVLFNSLITVLSESRKMAIARMIYRKGGIPRFVALLPQPEILNSDGSQEQPGGMHMIFLPYADDIRGLKLEPTPIAETDIITKAKKIVTLLKIQFDHQTFDNPALQQHYAIVQAVALEEPAPENPEDTLLPDKEGMEKYRDVVVDFRDSVFGAVGMNDNEDEGGGRKRKATSKAGGARGGPAAKKVKKEDGGDDAEPGYDDYNWTDLAASGGLKKLTIPTLKLYLKKKGQPLSGKKDDLIDRVVAHIKKSAK